QAMNDIEHVLRRELECIGDIDALDMDGISLTAEVVKHLDFEIGDELLKELEEDNPEAVSRIRRAMFTFEDLTGIDGRGFQTLLKEVTNDQLLMALKGSSDELRDKILGALSKRAAAMIMDDLDILPPQRLSVVEQAQQEIVEIAMRLEAEGKIQVAGHGGEDFV
ncbi:flagellar motor switch protein FliG, partial [Myxococcota bacterium]|nr:flagellar motor switch protein FliG [Myxococcota bacterium]